MDNILNVVSDFFYVVFDFLLGWVHLPAFPCTLESSINNFLDLVFGNLNILSFFIRPVTLKIAIPILIILINFNVLYKVIIWIVKKLPFLNIH